MPFTTRSASIMSALIMADLSDPKNDRGIPYFCEWSLGSNTSFASDSSKPKTKSDGIIEEVLQYLNLHEGLNNLGYSMVKACVMMDPSFSKDDINAVKQKCYERLDENILHCATVWKVKEFMHSHSKLFSYKKLYGISYRPRNQNKINPFLKEPDTSLLIEIALIKVPDDPADDITHFLAFDPIAGKAMSPGDRGAVKVEKSARGEWDILKALSFESFYYVKTIFALNPKVLRAKRKREDQVPIVSSMAKI